MLAKLGGGRESRTRNQAQQIQSMNKTLAEQEDLALWSLSADFFTVHRETLAGGGW